MNTNTIEQEIAALEQTLLDTVATLAQLKKQRVTTPQVGEYTFTTTNGEVKQLKDFFNGKDDLIVIHNMGKRCSYCTLWADGLNGFTNHLNDRAGFVLISPDSTDVQKQFADERGWKFAIASAEGNSFISDMGFSEEKDGRTYYHPGFSTFRKHPDGSITRVAFDMFGPGDMYCSPWHMFELLHDGTNNWEPKYAY